MDFPADLTTWTPWIDCASVVAVAYGVAKAFDYFEGLISDRSRVALWYYLADVPTDERIDSWGSVFPKLIDSIFGKSASSWKFVFRSCVSSIVALAFALTLTKYQIASLVHNPWGYALILQSSANVLFNFWLDYESLLISRAIVRRMAYRPTAFRVFLLSVADTIATALLAGIAVVSARIITVFYLNLYVAPHLYNFHPTVSMWFILTKTPVAPLPTIYGSPFFFSALFTSIWVWIYILSIALIKPLHRIRPLWIKLLPYLDIEKKPMQAIGRIAGIMAGAGYAVILGIVWLVHRGH
jgi:hypothetical protein